jgi:hypothetical protein
VVVAVSAEGVPSVARGKTGASSSVSGVSEPATAVGAGPGSSASSGAAEPGSAGACAAEASLSSGGTLGSNADAMGFTTLCCAFVSSEDAGSGSADLAEAVALIEKQKTMSAQSVAQTLVRPPPGKPGWLSDPSAGGNRRSPTASPSACPRQRKRL